jgi:MoaA/NifB/PqqE/SkfB family radical SAM enzyme
MSINAISRRKPAMVDIADVNKSMGAAQQLVNSGRHCDAFDWCEALMHAFPDYSVSILAAAYDWYAKMPQRDRYHLYQSRHFDFAIAPGSRVLDIGSGHLPFPFATDLADFAVDDNSYGRAGAPVKKLDGRDVYACNVEAMPFENRQFDFVNCSHVLEHTEKPENACEELMRVARRGYIETPTSAKDLWLNSADISNHRWAVAIEDGVLVFRQYTSEEIRGLGCSVLMQMHSNPETPREKAFAALVWLKADQVNTMFMWENHFLYRVHYGDGTVVANSTVDRSDVQPVRSSPPAAETVEEPMPVTFAVETVLGCNLRCPECAIGGGKITRHKEHMPLDRFTIIMDAIKPYAKYLFLHLWGEPMLNREIVPMIRYASKFTKTHISTNALTMNDQLKEELITSGVSDIIVSIVGVTQATYAKYRVGGKVTDALYALGILQKFNLQHGNKVRIAPQFIVFEHNVQEMDQFSEFCRMIHLTPSFKAPYIRNGEAVRSSGLYEYTRPQFGSEKELKEAMRQCSATKTDFVVLVDGTAVVCCHDYNGMTTMGNVLHQSVEEIWNSADYRQYRKNLIAGNAPDFCTRHCMSYFLKTPQAG